MKKQIDSTIKAHLLRSASYLLLLFAVSAIPFALAQRDASNRSATHPAADGPRAAQSSTRAIDGRYVAPPQRPSAKIPSAINAAQLPKDVRAVPASQGDTSSSRSDVPFPKPQNVPFPAGGTPTPTPSATPSCTPGIWTNEPPMANARKYLTTAEVGSNMYAITGFDNNPDYTAVNERFDGTSWTTLAPIPVPHSQSRGAVVGTKIYVPGGFNGSLGGDLDTMQIYDTTTDTWSMGMPLPEARSGVATAAFNGLVYVIGGSGSADVYIYDPETNSYTNGTPMPLGSFNAPGVLLNGEIYVVGGASPGHFAFNPTTNSWRSIALIPTIGGNGPGTCQSGSGFVLNNELWILGCQGEPIPQVWIYTPDTGMWRPGPQYNVDHQGPGAARFNNRGFVVGGGPGDGGSTAVESYEGCPATPSPTCRPSYTPETATGTITPGGTDIGNHCDDCITPVSLPFPVNVYDTPISNAWAGSNGTLQFSAKPNAKSFFDRQCVPLALPNARPFLNTLVPYYDNLRTDDLAACPDCGIFTQTLGTPPNRQFVIRYKTTYFNHSGTAEFEVLLTEGSDTLSVIYGPSDNNGLEATSGIQQDTSLFTSFSCQEAVLTPDLRVDYIPTVCATPTPRPTATPRPRPAPRPRPTPP